MSLTVARWKQRRELGGSCDVAGSRRDVEPGAQGSGLVLPATASDQLQHAVLRTIQVEVI